jgi:peptidoglycan/xylan/chitin deacetylase (PgdA/CDA1 family)
VHITAGPDVDAFNDGKGLDVAHDPEIQQWIRRLAARGYAIGDHGGWIHNYFGEHLTDDNEADFQEYLQMNVDALQKVLGRPLLEYSSPVGNHPQWVSRWLEQRGFIAYYFTGDSGMGPTQVYRDGKRDGTSIWAFPILHLGREASLEEMNFDSVPEPAVRDWLLDVVDFVASQHTARLVYSHPLGATRFIPTLHAWFQRTTLLSHEGRFRWYTMTQLAQFLNRRKAVEWSLSARGKDVVLLAKDKTSLRQMTWSFPQSRFERPRVSTGEALVRAVDGRWLVAAGDCRMLRVTAGER